MHMSISHDSTIMSLEQAKNNYGKLVKKYLPYFHISQIVSGKGPHSKLSKSNDYWNKYAKNASLTNAKCSAELNNIYNKIEMIMTIALWKNPNWNDFDLEFPKPIWYVCYHSKIIKYIVIEAVIHSEVYYTQSAHYLNTEKSLLKNNR